MTADLQKKECALIIEEGISRITIESIGPVGLGFPTRMSITSGPFTAVTEADAKDFTAFREALASLHKNLFGEAVLDFWGVEDVMVLSGDGRGGITVHITVTDGRVPCAASLTVKMLVDQSYLPDIIQSIDRIFLRF